MQVPRLKQFSLSRNPSPDVNSREQTEFHEAPQLAPAEPQGSWMIPQFQEIIIKDNEVRRIASQLSPFFNDWNLVTQDKKIMSWIRGYKIPFIKRLVQSYVPSHPK